MSSCEVACGLLHGARPPPPICAHTVTAIHNVTASSPVTVVTHCRGGYTGGGKRQAKAKQRAERPCRSHRLQVAGNNRLQSPKSPTESLRHATTGPPAQNTAPQQSTKERSRRSQHQEARAPQMKQKAQLYARAGAAGCGGAARKVVGDCRRLGLTQRRAARSRPAGRPAAGQGRPGPHARETGSFGACACAAHAWGRALSVYLSAHVYVRGYPSHTTAATTTLKHAVGPKTDRDP